MGKERSNVEVPKRRMTHIVKKIKIMKPVVKVSVKRLTNLQQRIINLSAERSSWEAKNKQLSDSLKDEKLSNASVQKELFEYKKLHHEALVSLNSYKIKQQQIREIISAYQIDNNPYPHLLVLSECLTNNKVRIDKINTLLSSGEQNNISCRQMENSSVNYCYKKSKKLSEPIGRVGPMVKGLLISKPHIMLKRVMIPPNNDPDPDIREAGADTSAQEIDIALSPIQEERQEEDIPMRQISYRKKKTSRLGKSTRRDKSSEDSHDLQTPFDISNNSTANNSPLMNRMEPVAVTRLEDLSRLLHNSSLMQVNSSQLENVANSNSYQNTNEKLYRRSHIQMPPDDPLEGCSWMTDNYRSSIRKSQLSHAPPSDSSDDDDGDVECLSTNKHTSPYNSSLPLSNPLMNSTANSSSRTYVIKKSGGSDSSKSVDTCSSPAAEPDSTSHLSLKDVSSKFYTTADMLTLSNSISAEYSSLNRGSLRHQRNKTDVRLHSVKIDERQMITENCEEVADCQYPEKLDKRTRKPKNHAYPGEEEIVSPKKGKKSFERVSVGKKVIQGKLSVGRKSLEKQGKSVQKKLSIVGKANLTSPKPNNNKQKKSLQKNVSTATKPKLTSPKSNFRKSNKSLKHSRNSLVQESVESTKNKPSTKRSSKLITPRNSGSNINTNNESVKDSDDHSSIRSRRNACKKISYKESPLNMKMRRN